MWSSEAPAPTSVIIKGRAVHPTRLLAKVRTGPEVKVHAAALAANQLSAVRGFDLIPRLVVLEDDTAALALADASAPDAPPPRRSQPPPPGAPSAAEIPPRQRPV